MRKRSGSSQMRTVCIAHRNAPIYAQQAGLRAHDWAVRKPPRCSAFPYRSTVARSTKLRAGSNSLTVAGAASGLTYQYIAPTSRFTPRGERRVEHLKRRRMVPERRPRRHLRSTPCNARRRTVCLGSNNKSHKLHTPDLDRLSAAGLPSPSWKRK